MGTEVYLREKMINGFLVPDNIDNYEEIDDPNMKE